MLFERHHKRLFNFFLHTAGKRQVAEDLVQEVFVRMLKYRRTFRGDSGFAPWMFRMARNVRVDHFRREARLPIADTDIEAVEPADRGPLPPELAETSESVEILQAAISQLAVEKRELLVMARIEFLSQAEIAAVLRCKVGTVKVRIHRAIKELSQIYQELASEARP